MGQPEVVGGSAGVEVRQQSISEQLCTTGVRGGFRQKREPSPTPRQAGVSESTETEGALNLSGLSEATPTFLSVSTQELARR